MRHENESLVRLRGVDLNLLKVFAAIFNQKSISNAAGLLCVSQPAVSNALKRLRELYSDPLFVRSGNGMIPTPVAQELLEPIQKALAQIDKTLVLEDAFQADTSHRVFTIALSEYGEFFFLPKIIQKLAEVAPGIEIVCLPSPGASLTLEMKSGAVDLVWDWVPIDESDYHVEKISEDAGYCIVREGHPLIDGQLSLDTFLAVEHVALLPTRRRNPRIEKALYDKGLERKVVSEVSHLSVMPQVVARSNLIATMPERVARLYAETMGLQVFPNPVYQDKVPVFQMWHQHFDDDEGHRWFREMAKKVACEA